MLRTWAFLSVQLEILERLDAQKWFLREADFNSFFFFPFLFLNSIAISIPTLHKMGSGASTVLCVKKILKGSLEPWAQWAQGPISVIRRASEGNSTYTHQTQDNVGPGPHSYSSILSYIKPVLNFTFRNWKKFQLFHSINDVFNSPLTSIWTENIFTMTNSKQSIQASSFQRNSGWDKANTEECDEAGSSKTVASHFLPRQRASWVKLIVIDYEPWSPSCQRQSSWNGLQSCK